MVLIHLTVKLGKVVLKDTQVDDLDAKPIPPCPLLYHPDDWFLFGAPHTIGLNWAGSASASEVDDMV